LQTAHDLIRINTSAAEKFFRVSEELDSWNWTRNAISLSAVCQMIVAVLRPNVRGGDFPFRGIGPTVTLLVGCAAFIKPRCASDYPGREQSLHGSLCFQSQHFFR
jgi:hypothetical protein